jgi:hypothetical protein
MAGQKLSLGLILGLVALDQALAGTPTDPSALATFQPHVDRGGPDLRMAGTLEDPTEDGEDEAGDPEDERSDPAPGSGEGTGGADPDPKGEPVTGDPDGFEPEPPLDPKSVWGDLRPLLQEPGVGGAKQGSVARPMAKAKSVYDPGRCPGTGVWCPECTGERGQAPAPLEDPVRPDWNRHGQALNTTLVAQAHLAKAKALAERVEDAFCRVVKRYHHPVPRHRKRALERAMGDAMTLYYQMVEEYQVNRRIRATFRARLEDFGPEGSGEEGVLTLQERLAYIDEALKAIGRIQKNYLDAKLPKVDARLQGRTGKDGREEEHIQMDPEPGKSKGKKHRKKLRGE